MTFFIIIVELNKSSGSQENDLITVQVGSEYKQSRKRLTALYKKMHQHRYTNTLQKYRDDFYKRITRWLIPKSDYFIFFVKDGRFHLSKQNKIGSRLWLRSQNTVIKSVLKLKKVGKTTSDIRQTHQISDIIVEVTTDSRDWYDEIKSPEELVYFKRSHHECRGKVIGKHYKKRNY